MDVKILREAGLSENESKVYIGLLTTGATTAGKIVTVTGVHRKNVYEALDRLTEKGLATYVIENKIKVYQPKSPKNIISYLEQRKVQIAEKEKEIEKSLPEFMEMYNSISSEIESEIYRGTEGIKTILNECLNYKEVLFIGATGNVENRLPYFWPHYNEKREKLECKWKVLLVHESKFKPITKSKLYEYKVLPKQLSGLNVIYIYGDYVANVVWLEKPIAFVIKHKTLANNYRQYFNYLWKTIK